MHTKSSNEKFIIIESGKTAVKIPPITIGKHYEKIALIRLKAIEREVSLYDLIETIYYDFFNEKSKTITTNSQWIEFDVIVGKRSFRVDVRYQMKAFVAKDYYADIAEQVMRQFKI